MIYDSSSEIGTPSNYTTYSYTFTVKVLGPSLSATPNSVEFGHVRMDTPNISFWSEREQKSEQIYVSTQNTSNINVSCDKETFFTVTYENNIINVTYNKKANVTGAQTATITITADDVEPVEIPVTATAYVPAQGDVIETPFTVTFDENGTYTYTINSLDGFYDDYDMTDYDDNFSDLVFKLEFDANKNVSFSNNQGVYETIYVKSSTENDYEKLNYGHLFTADTYYYVVAPDSAPSTLTITANSIEAPEITINNPSSYNNVNLTNPELQWTIKSADECKLYFGTSEETLELVKEWNEEALIEEKTYSYQTENLQDNTKYFWRVDATNEAGVTTGEVQSFVTLLPVPQNIVATSYTDAAWAELESGTYKYGVSTFVEEAQQTKGTEVIFEEGFENNGTNLPEGWNSMYYNTSHGTYNTTSDYCWKINSGDIYYSYEPMGSYSACVNNGGNSISNTYLYLISSTIDLSNKQNPKLSFYYRTPQYSNFYPAPSYVNTLKVKILTSESQCSDPANYGEYKWSSGALHVDEFTRLEEIDLSNYIGQVIYIVFESDAKYGRYTAIDNIQVSAEGGATETAIVWSNEIEKQGPATFVGSEGENGSAWNVADNWSTGEVPAAGADVIIAANAAVAYGNVNVSNLTINSGVSLTIATATSLTVTGTIKQNSPYSLILMDGGQIFQNNDKVTAIFKMNIDDPTDWSNTANKDGWQFISMPMTGVNYSDLAGTYNPLTGQYTCDYDLYKYDGTRDNE